MTLLLSRPIRGCLAAIVTSFLSSLATPSAAADMNYNGHYEIADPKAVRTFSLEVKQTGSRAAVTFSAAMADGSGAAPDAEGKGHVENGVLSFDFKDSFDNKGTCSLESKKDGYHLSMTVLKVVDPSPFHFYGNVLLKKTSNKP